MRYLSVLSVALFAGCSSTQMGAPSGSEPQLGERFDKAKFGPYLMIASAQLSPSATIRRGDIDYKVAVDDSKRAIYVSTASPAFRSPEGLTASSTLTEVLAAGGAPVVEEMGWGYFSQLPSGWYAGFFIARMDGDAFIGFDAPRADSPVSLFFRRK